MQKNNWVYLAMLLSLSACTSKNKQAEMIGSLQQRDIKLEEPAIELAIDPKKVREYYKDFLSVTNENKLYNEALRRLADLELKTG